MLKVWYHFLATQLLYTYGLRMSDRVMDIEYVDIVREILAYNNKMFLPVG